MKVIAIAMAKGGVGKTSITISFAHALMRMGFKVLLVDMDPQSTLSDRIAPNLYPLDDQHKGLSIYDALKDDVSLPIHKIDSNYQFDDFDNPCVDIVPGSLKMESTSILAAEDEEFVFKLLDKLTESLPKKYDFVLLDCPPSAGTCTKMALNAADEVLIVVPAGGPELDGLVKMVKLVELRKKRDNPNLKKRILVNKWKDSSTNRACIDEIERRFPNEVIETKIRESEAFNSSLNKKTSIFELLSKGNSQIDIEKFTKEYLSKK